MSSSNTEQHLTYHPAKYHTFPNSGNPSCELEIMIVIVDRLGTYTTTHPVPLPPSRDGTIPMGRHPGIYDKESAMVMDIEGVVTLLATWNSNTRNV